MGVFESPAVDVDEATAVNDIELDESGTAVAGAVAVGAGAADAVAAAGADAPQAAFAGVVCTLFRALCWLMLVAAVVYLGVAGMNYALISGAQIPEELRGTKILLTYSAVQAAMFAASGVMGLVGITRVDAQRYLRLAPCAPAVLVVAAEATQMFNMGDHILESRFIFGANFFFGILAVLAGVLAAVSLYLLKGQEEQFPSEYRAVVTFDTDPVVASRLPSSSSAVAEDTAQEHVRDVALDAETEASPVPDDMAAAEDELGEYADEEREDEFALATELNDDADDAVDDAADSDYEDDDEEEVERPHGAHF